MRSLAPQKEGPQSNEDIQSPDVQVIGAEGENLGVLRTREALSMAQDQGFDLVIISPNATPPVAKPRKGKPETVEAAAEPLEASDEPAKPKRRTARKDD